MAPDKACIPGDLKASFAYEDGLMHAVVQDHSRIQWACLNTKANHVG